MNATKQTWDTRAWLIGIVGGVAGGTIVGSHIYSVLLVWLSKFTGSSTTEHRVADTICYLFTAMILLVLPSLLSGLARRLTFFWGLLPLCLLLVSAHLEEWIENGTQVSTRGWVISSAVIGGCWVVSSGPVSLIRWLRVRAIRHHAALLASYQVQREANSESQEGVWPPPPEYKG